VKKESTSRNEKDKRGRDLRFEQIQANARMHEALGREMWGRRDLKTTLPCMYLSV